MSGRRNPAPACLPAQPLNGESEAAVPLPEKIWHIAWAPVIPYEYMNG